MKLRHSLLSLSLCLTLLSACGKSQQPSLAERLKNPLFAERYAEAVVDRLTELEIQKDPLIEDETNVRIIQEERDVWQGVAREARRLQYEGKRGGFVMVSEFARGETLLLGNTLYMSTLFETEPGPDLHLYLTTVIDPRDVTFPDETSVDVGTLDSPYGAQEYVVPSGTDTESMRSVVLFETKLKRIHGFAQLSK
ncbi:hypothetical protein COU80_02745 [Candidatus Peregrinibacteria bacterium CG10_big_fil_rev_8_21_14_0_10_55_24]|nr:MAG: hypothetical protein COU80_02745 [Candidatus Peregrinibacteria bacterium CG10_big_fil_rev_8_21_14_0_10_55_24]